MPLLTSISAKFLVDENNNALIEKLCDELMIKGMLSSSLSLCGKLQFRFSE